MEFKDYYQIMGVKRDATQDEIKRAYRRLARKYHPDVSKEKDAEIRFKEVGEAYEVLKDPRNVPPTTNSAPTGKPARSFGRRRTGTRDSSFAAADSRVPSGSATSSRACSGAAASAEISVALRSGRSTHGARIPTPRCSSTWMTLTREQAAP